MPTTSQQLHGLLFLEMRTVSIYSQLLSDAQCSANYCRRAVRTPADFSQLGICPFCPSSPILPPPCL